MTTEPERSIQAKKAGEFAVKIFKFVVKHCASATVTNLVKQNVTTNTKLEQAQLLVGTYVVSHMVADAAWNHATKQFIETYDRIRDAKKSLDESLEDDEATPITDL